MDSLAFTPELSDPASFFGRKRELRRLARHIDGGDGLFVVHGFGGVGKTELVNQAVSAARDRGVRTVWCSLRDAPPLDALISSIVSRYPSRADDPAAPAAHRLALVLGDAPTVIVLDNLDAVLPAHARRRKHSGGDDEYSQFLRRLAREAGAPPVIATSRFLPALPAGGWLKTIHLEGLQATASRSFLKTFGLRGNARDLADLAARYGGNPTALQLAAQLVIDVHGRQVREFLEAGRLVFGGVEDLFGEHLDALTPLERLVMFRLALAREPLTYDRLADVGALRRHEPRVIDALQILHRRSLAERRAGHWYLQYLMQEFCLSRLVVAVTEEIAARQSAGYLADLPLCDASQPIWVRETQKRLAATNLATALRDRLGGTSAAYGAICWALDRAREGAVDYGTFSASNVVTLHQPLNEPLAGKDFSATFLRRLDLSRERLVDTSLRQSELEDCRFASLHEHVFGLALSRDGRFGVLGQAGGGVAQIEVPGGRVLKTFDWAAQWLRAVTLSPNDDIAALTDDRGNVRMLSLATGAAQDVPGSGRQLRGLAFSDDAEHLFAGGEEGVVWRIGVRDGSAHDEPIDCGGEIWGLEVRGSILFITSSEAPLTLWHWQAGRREPIEPHQGSGRSLCVSPDGSTAYVGCHDGTVLVWDLDSGRHVASIEAHRGPIWSLAAAEQGGKRRLFTGSHDGSVRVRDVTDPRKSTEVAVLAQSDGPVWPVELDGTGGLLAAVTRSTSLRFWDANSLEYLEDLPGSAGRTLVVAARRGGDCFASGGQDGIVRLWDTASGTCIGELPGHECGVRALAFSPSGGLLASGAEDCECRIWDVASLQLRDVLRGAGNWIWDVAFDRAGEKVAAASADQHVHVWDLRQIEPARRLAGHAARVIGVHFVGDGESIVSCAVDGSVWCWDLTQETGRCVARLSDGISAMAALDDGLIALGDMRGTLRVLAAESGTELATVPEAHRGPVASLLVRPTASQLLSNGEDGRVRAWTLPALRPDGASPDHLGHARSMAAVSSESEILLAAGDQYVTSVSAGALGLGRRFLIPRQYEGLDITGARGLTPAERRNLLALGATDDRHTGTDPLTRAKKLEPSPLSDNILVPEAPVALLIGSPEDSVHLRRLEKHLAPLTISGAAKITVDAEVTAPDAPLRPHVMSADVVLLLISSDFLASSYCQRVMREALVRAQAGTAQVFVVLVRRCDWDALPIAELPVLPANRQPIADWDDPDAACTAVATELRGRIASRALSE